MNKKKIVIIGQWMYPKNTPRAFRSWELAKEFARNGYDVTVYALLADIDYSELEQKYHVKIKNLGIPRFGTSTSGDTKPLPLITRAMLRITKDENLTPNLELFPMIKKALKQEGIIDILITIAYPHTIHWATAKYIDRKKVGTWIADCGDPYMGNPFLQHPNFMKYVEKWWCKKVDFITIPIKGGISAYYNEFHDKIKIIPQGFDFSENKTAEYTPHNIPTFAFAGTIYQGKRDPFKFLDYIAIMREDYKFIIYSSHQGLAEYAKNNPRIEIRQQIPRNQLILELSKMDFLVNIQNINAIQSPSKMIDYSLAKRPIFTISTDFSNKEKEIFNHFTTGNYSMATATPDISNYDIRNVCKQFIALF